MPHSGRDEEWLRAQLHDLGSPSPDKKPLKPLYSTYSATWSQTEEDQAALLLIQASEVRKNGEVKTLITGGKVKPSKWAFEDYDTVLKQIVGSNSVSVGVLSRILLWLKEHQPKKARRGSLNLRKSVTEDEIRSLLCSLVMTALTQQQYDQVRILAHSSCAAGHRVVVSKALPTAIRLNDTESVQIIVEEGTDPNSCPEVFMECVAKGNLDFIRLLLRSQRGVSEVITTNALPAAVELGDVEMVQLLLAHGADADFKKGFALKHAIDVNRCDIMIMLLLCANPPSEATLASMVSYVWSEPVIFAGRQGQLIELLLNGGARGNDVDAFLSGAVEQQWGEMVQLLMDKGTRITCCNGQAYRQAVYAIDYEMLHILDGDKLGKDLATDIFGSLYTTKLGASITPLEWWKLATLLLAQGATGVVVHEALVNRVKVRDLKSVKLLLIYGASVDYNDGRALDIAIKSWEMDFIMTILHHNPKVETLNTVFQSVTHLPQGVQMDITRKLLEAGATGVAVDEVLAFALTTPICQRDHQFIEVLVEGKADVSQKDGFFIREVVRDGDVDTLQILLRGDFPTAIAFSCIPLAMDLGERQRCRILQILLDHGVRGGPIVAQALINSIDETSPSALAVAELLLTTGVASTAYSEGKAFKKAITCRGLEFLQLLVQFNQLAESEFCACLVLSLSLPRDEMRLKKVELLLTTKVNMSAEHWYTTLKHEMKCLQRDGEELSLVLPLLLDAGADVNYNGGQAICDSIDMDLFETFKLYLGRPLSTESHEAAFIRAADYTVSTSGLRYMEWLLKFETPHDLLNRALIVSAENGEKMKDLSKLLLENGACPNHDNGAALCQAIESRYYHPSVIELFLGHKPSIEAIAAGLKCAFDTLQGQERLAAINLLLTSGKPQEALDELLVKAVQEERSDPYLLKSLLRGNASALSSDGQCILDAVMKNDIGSLEILQPYFINDRAIVSRAFKTAWTKGARAEPQEAALSLLLKAGVTGKTLSVALVDTIETFERSKKSLQLILGLLDAGADVNYDHGASLVKAAAKGNARVLTELFTASPSQKYMTRAFPKIFRSGVDSPTLTEVIHAFCSHSAKPDLAASSKPILHLLLENYPNEKDLLKYLIDAGCPADTPVETSRGTYLSLLCWTLTESKTKISDDVIDVLLSAGANANYKTTSGHTPLGIAISTSRRKAVASLLRHGADPTVLYGTTSPKSLLHLAVTTENAAIIRLIMLASPMVNDGALHYAVREVNVEVMAILLIEGNSQDYAYSGCEGRTALAELCLKGDGTKPQQELVRAMTLLRDLRNFKKRSNGKSALHLALDNQRNATAMTQALLDSGMGDYVNDQFNLYEEDGMVYSPLAYVSKGRNKASALLYRESLLKLLKQFGCKNRFWAVQDKPQPSDVINPPEEIARTLAEKKDHERMLARIRDQSETAQAAIATQHELLLKNEQKLSKERSKLEKEAEARHQKMVASRHSAELAHIQNLAQQLDLGYYSSSDNPLAQYATFERERRQAELEHLSKQQKLITAAYKERTDIEQKNREANAREMRRLRELWYEVDPWD
ncbi:hypothetical protein BJX65DRAFT_315362 [Aspergillus insuetus]